MFVWFVLPSLVALVLVLIWLITTWVLVFMFAVLVVKCLVVCVAGLAGLVLFGACLWLVDLGVYDYCGCCVVVVDLWSLCGVCRLGMFVLGLGWGGFYCLVAVYGLHGRCVVVLFCVDCLVGLIVLVSVTCDLHVVAWFGFLLLTCLCLIWLWLV